MNRSSTVFLRLIICLIAVGVLLALVWFPQNEGRAENLDLLRIYTDPLILYVYLASTPFFFGLYQAFKLLNFIDANQAFSQSAVDTLKNMKLASLWLVALIAVAIFSLRVFAEGEDSAGPTMLGICLAVAFGVIGTAAAVFQKLFQNAVDLKSENDLTV